MHKAPARASPKLPWWATCAVLVAVFCFSLLRPFAPLGPVDFLLRQIRWPLRLDIGEGRAVRLVEERRIQTTGCQPTAPHWRPDALALVVECPSSLQIWSLDGQLLGSTPAGAGWPQKHLQILAEPFRIVYLRKASDASRDEAVLTSWDVPHDRTSTARAQAGPIDNFSVNQDQSRVALVSMTRSDPSIIVMALPGGRIERSIPVAGTHALRWLPGTPDLLLGAVDGVLRRVDTATGEVREVSRPSRGILDGLVLAPDGKAVATFDPLGAGVDILSVAEGRLLDHLRGTETGAVQDLTWDPRDRFIAVAGHDALFLWNRRAGTVAARSYGGLLGGGVHAICISDDGARLALTTATGLRIFRIKEQVARR